MHEPSQQLADDLDLGGLLEAIGLGPTRAGQLVDLSRQQIHHLIIGRYGTTIDRAQLMATRWSRATGQAVAVDDVLSAIAKSRARFRRAQKRAARGAK